ncbi:hypothetical protein SLE2022_014530 [Rubroshorea leprosula]|uniref:Uncharacterized protein n=1 Tax=Rubroshorea leprosula TaxID=152421 RepID=A0AAV5LY49_9ROSI|nr:hypothetical protein SLEP1_g49756 [Rubroshorea leprosula]
MSKNTAFLVCLLILALDIAAGVLGIEAEVAQNKVNHLRLWIFECRTPSMKAFQLGLAAAVLLVLAHAIANLLGGCIFFWSKDKLEQATPKKQLAFASLIFSWMMLAVGFLMLIMGALANSKSGKSCSIAHHRLLSIGGIVCFLHGLFSIAYYISATDTTQKEQHAPPRGQA